jgi:hypothetical protein
MKNNNKSPIVPLLRFVCRRRAVRQTGSATMQQFSSVLPLTQLPELNEKN